MAGYHSTATATGTATITYANTVVWQAWTSDTTATAGNIWNAWNRGATWTCTNSSANIWTAWNGPVQYDRARRSIEIARAMPTPEQAAAARARQEEVNRRYLEQEARRKTERELANQRAEQLLLGHLTEEQRAQLAREDWFLIVSASGKRYRINRGRHANVDVLDENNKVVRSLCVHPADTVPDADTMLAQKVMLQFDEERVTRMANVHPIHHRFRKKPLRPDEIAPVERRAA